MSYQDEIAEEIFYEKYSVFISKKIKDFHFAADYDDVFQESLLVLLKAKEKYIDSEIPFYSYFMRILVNKLSTFYTKSKELRMSIIEDETFFMEYEDDYDLPDSSEFKGLTSKEKLLINLIYVRHWKTKKIMEEFRLSKTQIYYCLKKAKEKIKENIDRN